MNRVLSQEVEKLPETLSPFYSRAFEVLTKDAPNYYLVFGRLNMLLLATLSSLEPGVFHTIKQDFQGSFSTQRFLRMHALISTLESAQKIGKALIDRKILELELPTPRAVLLFLHHEGYEPIRAIIEQLDFRKLGLTVVPPFHFPKLEFLDLSYNKLTDLPNSITECRLLKRLNIEGNPLKKENFPVLARRIADLVELEQFDTEYVELYALVEKVKKQGHALYEIWEQLRSKIPNLPHLSKPSELKLAFVPENPIFERIVTLDLKNCELEVLPAKCSLLRNLQNINLARNRFTDLPEALLTLKELKTIDLSLNPIGLSHFGKVVVKRLEQNLPKLQKIFFHPYEYTVNSFCCVIL